MNKLLKKLMGIGAVIAGGVALAWAVGLNGVIINQPGIAFDSRYTFNLQNLDVNTITATAVYSSAAFTSSSFSTGQVSTGSFLVVDNTQLSAAAASNTITVASTSGSRGDSIVIPKLIHPGAFVLLAGRDWNYGATTALTAASINAALAQVSFLQTNVVGSVIYATAPVGALYNSLGLSTNNSSTLTLGAATFLGGRTAATVYVNGYGFQAGRDFTIGGTPALTATAISNAINAQTPLGSYVTAATASSSVTFQSKGVGTLYNFPLATSNAAAVSAFNSSLVGGSNAAWALNSGAITVANHGYVTGLQVLYSTNGSVAIGGLTNQTTYYIVAIDANTVGLSSTSAVAQTGVYKTLTSSSTLTAAVSYTLAPLAWSAGSAGFDWEVSNDGSSWSRVAVTSVTYSDSGHSGAISWSMTPTMLNYQYLSLKVLGPTAGALGLTVTANGTFTF